MERIQLALGAAASLLLRFYSEHVKTEFKTTGDPVTEADRAANKVLFEMLPRSSDAWLSEESVDDGSRLHKDRVWIVDPLDGTSEFIAGIPEWSVSIALVERGQLVAGGVCNPATGETVLGSVETGIVLKPQLSADISRSEDGIAKVLASRSEVKRGNWNCFENAPFVIRSVGSVAYKLALVAAGFADATWTFVPKHEWDVAAGVALVLASGGNVTGPGGQPLVFNRPRPLIDGLIAISARGQKVYGKSLHEWLTQSRKLSVRTSKNA